jgi:hypothetical protein
MSKYRVTLARDHEEFIPQPVLNIEHPAKVHSPEDNFSFIIFVFSSSVKD